VFFLENEHVWTHEQIFQNDMFFLPSKGKMPPGGAIFTFLRVCPNRPTLRNLWWCNLRGG
jgi:hypothetical protein